MTSPSLFQFCSFGKNGIHRIDWFSHAWSEALAERPAGVLLALEPRMENTSSRNAVLSAAQQAAFDAWNSGFLSQQANPVSLRAVRPIGNFHRLEALSTGPETLQVDTFVTLSDGHWTSSGVRQKRAQHQVEFDIERGQHGLRIAVSIVRSSSHKPSLLQLVEVVDRGQGPNLKPLLVTPAIATMLSKKFGIDAQVNDDLLAAQQWNGGAAAVLQRLGSSFDPALGPAERLTLAYWRAASNLLGFGGLLVDPATRTQQAALRSVSSFPATFAPHEALESMAIAAANELGWLSATNFPTAATRWNEVCARATAFRSAFEREAVTTFPDPVPERCTDQATLERALLRVTAVRHLAGFSGSVQWGGDGEAIASIAESLMGSSAKLASFLQTVRVERVLKAEAAALAHALAFEFGSAAQSFTDHSATDTVQDRIARLHAALSPVHDLRRILTALGEPVAPDERTVACAVRVTRVQEPRLRTEVLAASKRALACYALGTSNAGAPPHLPAEFDGSIVPPLGAHSSVSEVRAGLERLQTMTRLVESFRAWSVIHREALLSQVRTGAVAQFPTIREATLAAATEALDALDGSVFRRISSNAPAHARANVKIASEVVEQADLFRLVCAALPKATSEDPSLLAEIAQIRGLLTALDTPLGPATNWHELEAAVSLTAELFGARSWFVPHDGSLFGTKRRLASAWRFRVASARYELRQEQTPFTVSLLDAVWSHGSSNQSSLTPSQFRILSRHGCLPDASFAYAVTKSWPS